MKLYTNLVVTMVAGLTFAEDVFPGDEVLLAADLGDSRELPGIEIPEDRDVSQQLGYRHRRQFLGQAGGAAKLGAALSAGKAKNRR